ncbi:MAG TPA: glycosyltransferase family 2 protein [Clostridiaceae bacterium]|nr:glycosyltransferase family 2 protein [Clostridiaceae bacterium]
MYISAIIPAYNEEKTISAVIKTLKKVKDVQEIIVVSDGSEDNTVGIAKECGAMVINCKENKGKAEAIREGLKVAKGDIIVLLDADLVGLSPEHVNKMIKPVIDNEVEMTIGIFDSGRFSTDLAQKIAPHLSGQRALKRYILDDIFSTEITGYGIEIAMTEFIEQKNIKVMEVLLEEVTHIMKEEKLGLAKGFCLRMKMYWQILRVYGRLRLAKR